mmetsp:Transcript_5847/g.6677  ORF Transcript_5847/g.6677 Transcript_5847/m.6677 type:complete len:483 (-) Transcript_5847:56-1504(-)
MASPCGPDCEKDWRFGAAGICNTTTLLCECPDGFNGIDEWQIFNDCHVDVNARLRIRYSMIAVTWIQILFALGSLLYFWSLKGSSLTWARNACLNRCSRRRREEREALANAKLQEARKDYELTGTFVTLNMEEDELFSEAESEIEREIAKQQEFAKKSLNSKIENIKDQTRSATKSSLNVIDKDLKILQGSNRRVSFMALFMLLFAGSLFFYQLSFLAVNDEPTKADLQWFQLWNGGWALASIVAGIWFLIFIWYKNLPELSVYGKLFGLSGLFINYSYLLGYLVSFMMVSSYILGLTFSFLLPTIYPEDLDKWDDALIWIIAVMIVLAIFLLVYLLVSLLRVYNSSLEALDLRRRAVEQASRNEVTENQEDVRDPDKPFKIQITSEKTNSEQVLKNLLKKQKELKRAQQIGRFILVFGVTAFVYAVLMAMGMLYIEGLAHNFWISFSSLTFLAQLVALLLNTMLVLQLRGKAKSMESSTRL